MGKTGASEGPERMAPPRQRLAPRMCRCPDDKNDGEKTKICLFGHLFGDFLFASLFFWGGGMCYIFFSAKRRHFPWTFLVDSKAKEYLESHKVLQCVQAMLVVVVVVVVVVVGFISAFLDVHFPPIFQSSKA